MSTRVVLLTVTQLLAGAARAQETTPSPQPAAAQPAPWAQEVKAAQSYLEGWFGGAITVPPIEMSEERSDSPELPGHYVGGVIRLRRQTVENEAEFRRVFRHELTHAVVDERTKGNCPHWLQEGFAQFLDGTDIVATNAWLRSQTASMIPLFRLEGPFQERDAVSRERAYRQSASAVSFLIARLGKSGMLSLIGRLGEGVTFERALLATAGLTYAELQQAWEASLRPAKPGPAR